MRRKKETNCGTFTMVSLNVFTILYTHTQLIHFAQQETNTKVVNNLTQWKQSKTKKKCCAFSWSTQEVFHLWYNVFLGYVNERGKMNSLNSAYFQNDEHCTQTCCAESLRVPCLAWSFSILLTSYVTKWYVNYTSTSPIGGFSPEQ